jgi:hypothetical protein
MRCVYLPVQVSLKAVRCLGICNNFVSRLVIRVPVSRIHTLGGAPGGDWCPLELKLDVTRRGLTPVRSHHHGDEPEWIPSLTEIGRRSQSMRFSHRVRL